MKQKFDLNAVKEYSGKTFRFGLLANSLALESWQTETLRLLLADGHRLEFVILKKEKTGKTPFFKKLRNYPYRYFLFRIWNRFIFKPLSKLPEDISPLLKGAKIVEYEPIISGFANEFSNEMIEYLQGENVDFILRFGFNILKGNILNVAQYGIWSFHHDDEQEIRGGPPGFWEFLGKYPKNGVILQKISHSLDKGYVLKKNQLPVIYHSYKAHLDQLYFESSLMPMQFCRHLQHKKFEPQLSETKAPILRPPGNLTMLRFLLTTVVRRIKFHLQFLLQHEDWHIARLECALSGYPENSEKVFGKIARPAKSNAYLADPFLLKMPHEEIILAEEFSYKHGKGRIVALKSAENFAISHEVLNENTHLSFPYVFEYQGSHFLLPESYQSHAIKLYSIDYLTLKAAYRSTLLNGFAAVDPVLFPHEGRWWLLFTVKTLPSVHLYAFYADKPEGEYTPHYNNPIKTDISMSRNAGAPFREDGKLFRPVQDCSLHYGRAVNICEIVRLTPEHFEERFVKRIEPNRNGPYPHGLHTYNFNDKVTLIDGKRYHFSLSGFFHQLSLKF